MKTIIFSDTHLTEQFNKRTYSFLKRLINQADQVIINGDFWDAFSTSFDQFVTSKWKELFPLLKQKQTIYIYGNHDRPEFSDERVNFFSVIQKSEHLIATNPKKLIIKHGHQYTPNLESYLKYRSIVKFFNRAYGIAEGLVLKLFGRGFFRRTLYRSFTFNMVSYAKKNLKKDEVLVCGHSHNAEFLPEQKYINSGFIRHGLAQYLVIENKKIRFVEEQY